MVLVPFISIIKPYSVRHKQFSVLSIFLFFVFSCEMYTATIDEKHLSSFNQMKIFHFYVFEQISMLSFYIPFFFLCVFNYSMLSLRQMLRHHIFCFVFNVRRGSYHIMRICSSSSPILSLSFSLWIDICFDRFYSISFYFFFFFGSSS